MQYIKMGFKARSSLFQSLVVITAKARSPQLFSLEGEITRQSLSADLRALDGVLYELLKDLICKKMPHQTKLEVFTNYPLKMITF